MLGLFFHTKRAGVILYSPFMLVVMFGGHTSIVYDLNILLKDEYFVKKSKLFDFDCLIGFNKICHFMQNKNCGIFPPVCLSFK